MTRVPPPGPRRSPSLDELKALRDGPHEFLRRIAATYGPVVRYPAGPVRFFLVTAPEDVQRVLVSNHGNYSKDTFQYRLLARITGHGLLTMDGPPWLRRRRLAQPSFHRNRILDFAPLFARTAAGMGDRWGEAARRGEVVDVARDMMLIALQAVVEALFGGRIGDEGDALARATLDVLHHIMAQARTMGVVPGWLPTRGNRRFRKAMGVLEGAIRQTLEDRRGRGTGGEGGDDLLGRLMAARIDGESLTDQELRDEMITLLIAGHETVASALMWTWDLLATEPEAEARFHVEVDALPSGPLDAAALGHLPVTAAVFQEALRLYPPAWIITRKALGEDVLGGCAIPEGALVVLSPYVTQRDGGLWEEPDRFRPERFLAPDPAGPRFAYFPFGGGPHLCIGNHFALVEAAMILATLGRRFRLCRPSNRAPEVDPGVTLQPRGGLPMRVEFR